MKRSPASIVVSALLLLLALRLFRGHAGVAPDTVRLSLNVAYIVLALLTLMTAWALWRRKVNAMRLFVVWAIGYLGLGAVVEYFAGDPSLARSALWCAVIAAILLAVGAHLRFVERQAG